MQTGESEEFSGVVGQPSVKSFFVERPIGLSAGIRPVGFVRSHAMQKPPTHAIGQIAAGSQGPLAVATRVQNLHMCGFEMVGDGEHQQPTATTFLPPVTGEYMFPYTQLEFGHSMTEVAYPYTNPYFRGIIAAYGAQAMIRPHMLEVQQTRMPLPSEILEEEPVYVNAKQYHGILRRRQVRAKAESENKLIRVRKPYLHESRHLHAMRRARGCGGRFLNTKNKDDSKAHTDGSNNSSDGQSSQAGSTASSKVGKMEQCLMFPQGQGGLTVHGMPEQVLRVMRKANDDAAGYHQGVHFHDGHAVIPSGIVQGSFIENRQSQAFHPLPDRSDEDEGGDNRGILSSGS